MPPGKDARYNSGTYGVPKNGQIYALGQDAGIFPEVHDDYLVYNIGRTAVFAKVKYGTKFAWSGDITSDTIQPGERKLLKVGGRPYFVTGLIVYNQTDIRVIVHCGIGDEDTYALYASKEPGTFDENINNLLKQVFVMGVKYIPDIGPGLSGLLNTFWPEKKPSVWEQIQDRVKALVNEKVLESISGILGGDLRYCKERITVLLQEINDGVDKEDLKIHYMNIAQDLIGFENKFIFDNDIPDYQEVNKFILPHYSAFILMKVSFYVIGIQRQNEIGLTSENVKIIKSYANRTIHSEDGANKYITKLYKDRVDNAYNNWLAEDLYDNIMNVRSYIATQGLEYIIIWNHMLEHPMDKTDPYNDVISYSTLYGRQTADIIKESIPDQVPGPLTPKLSNGKRSKITYIEVYIWRINDGEGPPKIGGMTIHFDNNETYTMGTQSEEINKIDFNDSLLNKLQAYGDGAIDYLIFHFSDGRTATCGSKAYHDYHADFELNNHHIVSIYLASDNYSLGGQAANISVAYQLIPK